MKSVPTTSYERLLFAIAVQEWQRLSLEEARLEELARQREIENADPNFISPEFKV